MLLGDMSFSSEDETGITQFFITTVFEIILTRLRPNLAQDQHYIYKLFYVLNIFTYYKIINIY